MIQSNLITTVSVKMFFEKCVLGWDFMLVKDGDILKFNGKILHWVVRSLLQWFYANGLITNVLKYMLQIRYFPRDSCEKRENVVEDSPLWNSRMFKFGRVTWQH